MVYIPPFFEGFNTSQIDCLYKQTASVISVFKEEYYYYFCFMYAILSNWYEGTDDLKFIWILRLLGISFRKHPIKDGDTLQNLVLEETSKGRPVMYVNTINSMYYFKYSYKKDRTTLHAIIFSEYDYNNGIVTIKDYCNMESVLNELIDTQPLFDVVIKEDEIPEIVNITNDTIGDISIAYTFSASNPLIGERSALVQWGLNAIANGTDILNSMSRYFKTVDGIDKQDIFIREKLYGSMEMFFGVLERLFKAETKLPEYQSLKKRFLSNRKKIVNQLLLNRDINTISMAEMERAVEGLKVLLENECFFSKKNKIKYTLIKPEIITVDSEFTFCGKTISANNIMNKEYDWTTGAWISANDSESHWIKYELAELLQVKKIIVQHEKQKNYRILQYSILISLDGIEWKKVVESHIDNKAEDIFIIDEKAKFVKLVTERNSKEDEIARLYGFEVYT